MKPRIIDLTLKVYKHKSLFEGVIEVLTKWDSPVGWFNISYLLEKNGIRSDYVIGDGEDDDIIYGLSIDDYMIGDSKLEHIRSNHCVVFEGFNYFWIRNVGEYIILYKGTKYDSLCANSLFLKRWDI
jgi:hypothetical protein